MPHGFGQMRVVFQSSCRGFFLVRTKCLWNWLTRTTTPSTRAWSHLSFLRRLQAKSITDADGGPRSALIPGEDTVEDNALFSGLNNIELAIDAPAGAESNY